MKQNLILRASSVNYLGVFVDNQLIWTRKINQIALILFKYSGIIYKLRDYVDSETLLVLHYSLGYSYIQYGITIWGPAANRFYTRLKLDKIIY